MAPATAPVAQPLPPAPTVAAKPIPAGSPRPSAINIDQIRKERQQTTEGGRTIIREPGRVIVKDPNGQSFIRHSDVDRFRYGARDIRVQRQGNDTQTIIVRPDAGVSSIADLKGKTILTTANAGVNTFFPLVLKNAGLTPDDITVTNVPDGALVSSYLQGAGGAVGILGRLAITVTAPRTRRMPIAHATELARLSRSPMVAFTKASST